MKIAQLQYGEPIETRRQSRRDDVIRSDSNARGISLPNPIETRQFQYGGDEPLGKRKILDMEEVQALTENLSFVVSFDSEPLICRLDRSKPALTTWELPVCCTRPA